jgi:hypothetical protein
VTATRRASAIVIFVAGCILATATIVQVRAGARAIERSDAALSRADRPGAIAAARDAAQALVPGSPYPTLGYRRIEAIARDAEIHGDDTTAISAWRAMRAAALSTRAITVSTGDWLDEANSGIARVGSLAASGGPDVAKRSDEMRPTEQALLAALKRDDTPSTLGFALLALGGAALFAGVGRLAWRAGHEPLTWARARMPVASAVLGLIAYIVACLRA